MPQYIVKSKKTSLKSPLGTTDTSVVLRNLVDSKSNTIAMSAFGDWGVIVIKQSDSVEMIKFDSITQNADGSATLGIATSGRHLDPTTPYAGSSTGLSFQSGAEVIVTNDPLTISRFARLDNANTFSVVPKSSADPVDDEDLTRKSWVLNNLPAGAVSINRVVVVGNAGETIAQGELVYLDYTDNEWKKTDATNVNTVNNVILGIAQGAGTNGNPIANGILIKGVDNTQTGMTAGDIMYVSNTAGDIANSAGTNVKVIGVVKDADELYFDPIFYGVALQSSIQNSSYVYGADTGGDDTYELTLNPVPSAYVAGQVFYFKPTTANTGACTLNINSLGAKSIKKNVSQDLDTGDIKAGQMVIVQYDGTNFQLVSHISPSISVQVFNTNQTELGDSTSQYDITNPTGSTFRYTYDGTGTDPNINTTTVPVGAIVQLVGQTGSISSGNLGKFTVTASGTNYFEVTNSGGVAENNKNLTVGFFVTKTQTYTKPTGVKYIEVEVQAGGGASVAGGGGETAGYAGGGGGYAKKLVDSSLLGSTETLFVGGGGKAYTNHNKDANGGELSSMTITGGSTITANGGNGGTTLDSGDGGSASNGDLNIAGQKGGKRFTDGTVIKGGNGGDSMLGKGGVGGNQTTGTAGVGYGGGGGAGGHKTSNQSGYNGSAGIIIIKEYF